MRADKRRPAVVVQADVLAEARVRSFLVVPLTTRGHLAGLPGNVALDRRETGLSRDSVANVYDVQKVLRADLLERVAMLRHETRAELDAGLRLVLGL